MAAPIVTQSGVIPYRLDGRVELEVMLVTSTGGARWVVPKGHVEPGMTARASAVKEAFEEAGIVGAVDAQPVAVVRYRKAGSLCEVDLYPMEVALAVSDWPERSRRRRRWVPADEAPALVHLDGFERCILLLRKRLAAAARRGAAA